MDTKFNLNLWKSSSFLPAVAISLILILGVTIFITSPINLIYIQKKSRKTIKGKFKITFSFKTLYTISGAKFIMILIQCLIFYKGIKNELILLDKNMITTRQSFLPSFNRQTSKDVCQEKARYIYWVMEFKRRKSEHERKGLKIKEVQFLFVGLGSNSLKGSLFFLLYFSNPFHKISS